MHMAGLDQGGEEKGGSLQSSVDKTPLNQRVEKAYKENYLPKLPPEAVAALAQKLTPEQEIMRKIKEQESCLDIGKDDNEALVFPTAINVSGKENILLMTSKGILGIDASTEYTKHLLSLISERFKNQEKSEAIKSSIKTFNNGRMSEDQLKEGIFENSNGLRFKIYDPNVPIKPNKIIEFAAFKFNPVAAIEARQRIELQSKISGTPKVPQIGKV